MTDTQRTIAEELERYLRTGDTDPHHAAWPGGFLESAQRAHDDLRSALAREVKRLAAGRTPRPLPETDTIALTRRKVEPMVRGLFSRVEQDAVLAMLEKSVVFLTSDNIERLLREHAYDSSAWDLANLYLASVGAELLGEDAPLLVGLSEATTCYVSPEYFAGNEPFADFIVHEAAHTFHNCKRRTMGLPETRWREWLLDIEFRKRETFAYSCEAYSRVLERASTASERRELAADFTATVRISDERVDAGEVAEIVRDAAAARNGWKVILARCASIRRPLSPLTVERDEQPQGGRLSQAPRPSPSPARQRRSGTGAPG
ncbi:hypothetical protein [Vitiosangium sp. GDMCC 1.1324]|uniref:hypothetical protein n=1 Tax=Vitiosangium sp. (strain GDMCC 1.1324) TaxID=2138576 RepID=UPI000D3AE0C6|nr:hypothetical protein [Vitiosangium sp. GDMCC 1.1324]PTL75393.1 hypothetical protein DAT35_54740 [Vitiosangium sp. GDMCC 1.1324]